MFALIVQWRDGMKCTLAGVKKGLAHRVVLLLLTSAKLQLAHVAEAQETSGTGGGAKRARCDERGIHSICGAEMRKSVSSVLRGRGDLLGLARRRMGEREPAMSARSTSFSFASSRFTFHPIGIPIAQDT